MLKKAIVIEPGYTDYAHEREALGPLGFEVKTVSPKLAPAAFAKALGEATLVFVRDTELDAEKIRLMKQARGIVRYGVGVDTIDLKAAKEQGIVVARVSNYGAEVEVADHAVSLFLAVKRRIVTRDRDVRNGAWQVDQKEPIGRIAGSTLGLFGYGRIARAMERRMRGFGIVKVIAFDPFLTEADNVELVSLDDLAERSDILSLHAPATDENHGIIDEGFLKRMKSEAILVNTGRGSLINEPALCKALSENWIFGAGLDVFDIEPPVRNPLLGMQNAVVTDHMGWYSEATVRNIQVQAAEQAAQILKTGTASNRVA